MRCKAISLSGKDVKHNISVAISVNVQAHMGDKTSRFRDWVYFHHVQRPGCSL